MKILNLTQHKASPTQADAGVVDLPASRSEELRGLLTFDVAPQPGDVCRRAKSIARLATRPQAGGTPEAAMIGGAMWLMAPLARELRARGIKPLFSFSVRAVEEVAQGEETRKVSIFRHQEFVVAAE